ncbi:hypothetical protein CWM47_33540 [Spirosoma pollinicola]|uniref:Uncharacterized protein n=2 Tax=Spirosoma pollinicola TaxID=2057025 RepID=A0A2K8Z8Y1_9BACT|nr:hypothetical protein CWM47_33540 [Spirosoma pollinicola]
MKSESVNDPSAIGKNMVESLGKFLDEEVPFTLENQRLAIGGPLTDRIHKELNGLKREFQVEEVRLIEPEKTYTSMLQESLKNAITQLETYADWPAYQTESIDFFTDKLIKIASQRSIVIQLEKIVKPKPAPEEPLKIGTWITFIDSVSDDQKSIEKAYALGEFIKWLVAKINLNHSNTPTNDIKPSFSNSDEKLTVPAIALMLVYLDKIGYFEGGKSRKMIREEEAVKYGVSADSLYNDFRHYKVETNRRQKSVIPHIEKAICLLDDWGTAIEYAQADLSYIKAIG